MTELMVATVIMSVGLLGLFGAFKYIARSTLVSRGTSLATNLGQERIESLKNLSYYSLQITTTPATSPLGFEYDTVNYPPETISIGGITFQRFTHVSMAEMTANIVSTAPANYPDTGLKLIRVEVLWTEAGGAKRWTLRNLLENPNVNPLDATLSGTVVNSAGGVVASAVVVVEQNEDWGATTNAAGAYSFSVYHGTYTVHASSTGFSDGVSSSVIAVKGATPTTVPNISLTPIATGYVTGTAWYNNGLVISQVVADTETVVGDGSSKHVEYAELYNPTTFPINIGTTDNAFPKPISFMIADFTYGAAGSYNFDYGPKAWNTVSMVNITTYVAPGHYYLISNASYFYILGNWISADAYLTNSADITDSTSRPSPSYPDMINNNRAGMVGLYSWSSNWITTPWMDTVGWADNDPGHLPDFYEGTYIPMKAGDSGLGNPAGKQIVRVSSPGINAAMLANFGRAYDSTNNERDFLYDGTYFDSFSSFIPPKNHAAGAFTTLTGKVPTLLGTVYASLSDENSGSTTAFTSYLTSGALSLPYSRFQIAAVSTGTWSLSVAYSTISASYDNVVVSQSRYTGVPNTATSPASNAAGLNHIQMTSTTVSGFIKGTVRNQALSALSGITVQAGGSTKITGSNGVFFLPVTTGTVTMVVNPNNANASYVEYITAVTVYTGMVTSQDVTLSAGGRITGYVTTGTTPLANQAVAATSGGSQAGSGVSDTSGGFTIRNMPAGNYTVFPVMESGQDSSPNTLPATVVANTSVFIGTFTVSGAFGTISGTVRDASGLVTSGALILASTNTIASTPAAIVASSAPSQVPLYMVSSKADGSYTLPVRGGSTYNVSAYVPVISGTGVSITTKTYSGIAVSASGTTTRDVTIP